MNRALFLGLESYESHYAHYPDGSFYKKHFDVLRKNNALSNTRLLTHVLYLTPEWKEGDGGELVMYKDEEVIEKIAPLFGVMTLFLSEQFLHEVLPSQTDRYSIATWFKSIEYIDQL